MKRKARQRSKITTRTLGVKQARLLLALDEHGPSTSKGLKSHLEDPSLIAIEMALDGLLRRGLVQETGEDYDQYALTPGGQEEVRGL